MIVSLPGRLTKFVNGRISTTNSLQRCSAKIPTGYTLAIEVSHKPLQLAGGLLAAVVLFPLLSWAAPPNTRAIIHIPTKSLTSMPLFFGRDKGFFTREGVDADLVLMSPPTAIAALVAGGLGFFLSCHARGSGGVGWLSPPSDLTSLHNTD